jgi:hypothetical protein
MDIQNIHAVSLRNFSERKLKIMEIWLLELLKINCEQKWKKQILDISRSVTVWKNLEMRASRKSAKDIFKGHWKRSLTFKTGILFRILFRLNGWHIFKQYLKRLQWLRVKSLSIKTQYLSTAQMAGTVLHRLVYYYEIYLFVIS